MTLKKENIGFYKSLFIIAIPIMLQQLMQTFVNMLDTIMVGQLGAIELASVGLGNQVFFILNMILFGTASGGSIFISQYWGKNDVKKIRQILGIMLSISTIVSLIFAFGAIFVPEVLLRFYSSDEAVIQCGAKYLRVIGFSYPIMAIGFAFQFAFRSTEHVRLPMICTMISFSFNALLNLLFIFGFKYQFGAISISVPALGVAGAALATLVSRSIETAILLVYSYKKKYEACCSVRELFSFDLSFVAYFFRIALPVLCNETLWGTGITLENAIFARAGTNAIAAFNITGTISQLTWVVIIGCGNAAGIIIGKQIGSGKEKEARTAAYHFAWLIPILALSISALLYPLSLSLPFLFNVDSSILQQAKYMLWVLICFYPFNSFDMVFIVGFCRAGGDTKYAAFHDIFWMWAISIPLGFLAALFFHLPPWQVYIFLNLENILKALAGLARLHSGKWLHNVAI